MIIVFYFCTVSRRGWEKGHRYYLLEERHCLVESAIASTSQAFSTASVR